MLEYQFFEHFFGDKWIQNIILDYNQWSNTHKNVINDIKKQIYIYIYNIIYDTITNVLTKQNKKINAQEYY